jgi:hypothetical protein
MILVSLNMPHLIVIYGWDWPFRVDYAWPHRNCSISISFIHYIIFIDSALALADSSSLFGTRIDVNLADDLITERVKLAVTRVKVWLHCMSWLISAQTLHRLTRLLHNVIQWRLLTTTARALQKWAVISQINIYLTIAGSFLKIKISSGNTSWSPHITFMLWTCLLFGEKDILFRLLKITLILTWKLFLNNFLSLFFRDRKSMFLQVHVEIHLECGSFLLLLVIIMDPET